MERKYAEFAATKACELLAIDSPSGYTRKAATWVKEAFEALGFAAKITTKGGVLADLGGADKDDALFLQAHTDTLGAMVAEIKANGRLKLTPLGGLRAENAETENVRVHTRTGKIIEGTVQLCNASVHVNGEYGEAKRTFDTVEVVLDEDVKTAEATRALGIEVGDIVCLEPRTRITSSGYIKSRFLDDKVCCAILLAYAKYVKEENVKLPRAVWLHFSVYEEIGTGGATLIPQDAHDIVAVDMGCVGELQTGSERKVTLCAKDSKGPYHYEFLKELAKVCIDHKVDYVVDTYFRYGSDVEGSLTAGYDARHITMGPGVYASHGYERTHISGLEQTFECIRRYLEQ